MLPAPPAGSMRPEATTSVESLLPSGTKRNVAVIADTSFAAKPQSPESAEVGRAIPFFGMLIGLSYIGHAVWIFEGAPEALEAGCPDADVLIVDSEVLLRLPKASDTVPAKPFAMPTFLCSTGRRRSFCWRGRPAASKGKWNFHDKTCGASAPDPLVRLFQHTQKRRPTRASAAVRGDRLTNSGLGC
jgi:hypothetical protein